MIFSWFRRRRERALMERDAADLIAEFGDDAGFEAAVRDIEADPGMNSDRPRDHWDKVEREIRRRRRL